MREAQETITLTEFQSNAEKYVRRVRETKTPLLVVSDGQPQVIVQDAETYFVLMRRVEDSEVLAKIRVAEE